MNNNKQRGMGMLSTLTSLILFGFVAMTLVKIAPMYMEYYSIRKIVDDIADGSTDGAQKTVNIRNSIATQLNINSIDDEINAKDFKVESLNKRHSRKKLSINYEKKVNWISNLNLIANFDYSRELGKPKE